MSCGSITGMHCQPTVRVAKFRPEGPRLPLAVLLPLPLPLPLLVLLPLPLPLPLLAL